MEIDIRNGLLVRRNEIANRIVDSFEKGIYVDDKQNRKLARVGATYGGSKIDDHFDIATAPVKPQSKWVEVSPKERAKLIYKTTLDKYTNTEGKFTEERTALHGKIISKLTNVKEQEKPHAILLLGGGASGKSHVFKTQVKPSLPSEGEQYAYVNNDDIKEMLPDYAKFMQEDAPSAASRVHEESRAITKMVLRSLKNTKKNFVFDATLNDYDKALTLTKELKGLGYKVEIVGVIVDIKTAETNAKTRYEKTGRAVPDYILRSAQMGSRRTFHKLEKHNREIFSNMTLYNNDGSITKKPPVKIYENGKQLDESKYAMVKQYH